MVFPNYFPTENPINWVHDAWTGRYARVHGGPSGGASPLQGMSGAMVLQISPMRAREGEGDEAKPMWGSPEHKRRQ
jgi:hypothetical protein